MISIIIKMLKFIVLIIFCLTPSYSLTFNHSIQLSGGWCSICGGPTGNYACSNELNGGWKDYYIFQSQSPANHVVAEIKVYLTGEWSCEHPYSTIAASVQTTELGAYNASGLCYCGMCDEMLIYRWREFGKCFSNFKYNGPNLVRVDVQYGLICLSKIDIEVTYLPGNPLTCGCGNFGNCTSGHMRCVDEYSYQTCALNNAGSAYWGPIQHCNTGLTCNSSGNFIYCNQILPTQVCIPGQMRCVNNQSYQTCAINLNGNTHWQTAQYCQAGLVCNPDPTGQIVMCVPQQFVRGIPGECPPRAMRCVPNYNETGDTKFYQMCQDSGVWNPVQKCAEDHVCSPSGNVIYCVPQLAQSNCTYRNMRCITNTTYQVCDMNANRTYWNVAQSCQTGLVCHQHDSNIYCY